MHAIVRWTLIITGGKKALLDEAFAVDNSEKDAKENCVGLSGLMSSQRLCCAEIRIVITD